VGNYDKYYGAPNLNPVDVNAFDSEMRHQSNEAAFTTKKAGIPLKKKALGAGFGIGAGIETVINMRNGDDFGTAAVKGAFSSMLWTTAPWVMGAIEVGKAAPALYEGYQNWMRQKQSWWNQQFKPNTGGNYMDTQRALTMRQASIEAIQGSKMNARSALGGEARLIANNFNRG
jgi:hypothetical protein